MDPDATLQRAERAIKNGDLEDACEALEAYANWRASGGFEPEQGDSRFDTMFTGLLAMPLMPTNYETPGAP